MIAMNAEHHFHLEILAPNGLGGIEPHLHRSLIPLEAYFSNFTKQVILRLRDEDGVAFDMDGSLGQTLHGSGHVCGAFEDATRKLDSLSRALHAAGFPHFIRVDDAFTERTATFSYCESAIDLRCGPNRID